MGDIYNMGLEDNQLDELMHNELLKYAQFIHRFKPALLRLSRLNIMRKSKTYDFGSVNIWNRGYNGTSDFEIVLIGETTLFYLRTNFDDLRGDADAFKTFFCVNHSMPYFKETPIDLDIVCPTVAKNINDSIHCNTALILGLGEFNSMSDQIYNEFYDFVCNKWEEQFGPSLKFDGEDLFSI